MRHYVWEKHNGPIPRKHVIRFVKWGQARRPHRENLKPMSLSEWNKRLSPHLNQFTSPTGSRKSKMSVRDRVGAERDARWERAMAI